MYDSSTPASRNNKRAYVDGVYDDDEYRRQKQKLELGSLVLPEVDATAEAGRLIQRLRELWSGANEEERLKLSLTMMYAVYVDTKETRSIVAVRPKILPSDEVLQ